MVRLTATVKGTNELLGRLRRNVANFRTELAPVVHAEAQSILAQSLTLVPRDTGDLAQSAFVGAPVLFKTGAKATAGYQSPHAYLAHEAIMGQFQRKNPPKFLEKALDGRLEGFKASVVAAITRTLSSK